MALICGCRKGYASEYDGLCRFCREECSGIRREIQKKVGVTHRGDGMTIEQYLRATKL